MNKKANMKNLLFAIGILLFTGMILGGFVIAAETGTVAATVTAQNISVYVHDASVAYLTVSISSSASTCNDGVDNSQIAGNNGSITEDFNIKGTDSVTWTLESAIGTDNYMHSVCTTTCDATPVWYALAEASYLTLDSTRDTSGANNSTTFDLKIDTPSVSGSYSVQSVDVVVQAISSGS